jgi:hypothetical protein
MLRRVVRYNISEKFSATLFSVILKMVATGYSKTMVTPPNYNWTYVNIFSIINRRRFFIVTLSLLLDPNGRNSLLVPT